jgi:Fe-Mn family superoxide dismutase
MTNQFIKRRQFLMLSSVATGAAALGLIGISPRAEAIASGFVETKAKYPFVLEPLPYEQTALEPYISANTLSFHYGKHHAGYVKNLNNYVKDTKYANMSLERIIKLTQKDFLLTPIYNNAAQTWNHSFYWQCLTAGGGDATLFPGKLSTLINEQFGHFSDASKDANGAWVNPGLKQKLFDAAKNHFASGWAWLVLTRHNKLEIITTKNADTPLTMKMTPLLVIDVWEHAYYLDYQNSRANYLTAVLDNLINWQFAEANLPSTTTG